MSVYFRPLQRARLNMEVFVVLAWIPNGSNVRMLKHFENRSMHEANAGLGYVVCVCTLHYAQPYVILSSNLNRITNVISLCCVYCLFAEPAVPTLQLFVYGLCDCWFGVSCCITYTILKYVRRAQLISFSEFKPLNQWYTFEWYCSRCAWSLCPIGMLAMAIEEHIGIIALPSTHSHHHTHSKSNRISSIIDLFSNPIPWNSKHILSIYLLLARAANGKRKFSPRFIQLTFTDHQLRHMHLRSNKLNTRHWVLLPTLNQYCSLPSRNIATIKAIRAMRSDLANLITW